VTSRSGAFNALDGPASTERNESMDMKLEVVVLPVTLGRPAAQDGIKALIARGFHKPGDVENRLGYYVGQIRR
jgi:hypothetical protein